MTRVRSRMLTLLGLVLAGSGMVAAARGQEPAMVHGGDAPAVLPQYEDGAYLEGYPQHHGGIAQQYYSNSGVSPEVARLYPAPHPVPAYVGQTYYTYQPLMPHEYLYAHRRVYLTPYGDADSFYGGGPCGVGGAGLNKTTVVWSAGGQPTLQLPAALGGRLGRLRSGLGALGSRCTGACR